MVQSGLCVQAVVVQSQDYVFKRLWFRVRIMCSSGCGSESGLCVQAVVVQSGLCVQVVVVQSGLCVQAVVVQSQDYVFKQSDLSTTIVDSVRWQHKTRAKPS